MLELQEKFEKLPQDDSAAMEEKLLIYSLVRATKPMVCVETGTHKGLSALYIAQALQDNGKGILYTLDPHDYGQKENIKLFPELAERTRVLLMKGVEFSIPGKIDFFFCDGNHDKGEVLDEIDYFFPHLSDDALVIFHDCDRTDWNEAEGVNAAIRHYRLRTAFINSKNKMQIYSNSEND